MTPPPPPVSQTTVLKLKPEILFICLIYIPPFSHVAPEVAYNNQKLHDMSKAEGDAGQISHYEKIDYD